LSIILRELLDQQREALGTRAQEVLSRVTSLQNMIWQCREAGITSPGRGSIETVFSRMIKVWSIGDDKQQHSRDDEQRHKGEEEPKAGGRDSL
jgi:hypothetical protein